MGGDSIMAFLSKSGICPGAQITATISASLNAGGSGSGYTANSAITSPVPYTYSFTFSLNDVVSLDGSGGGQTDSVSALFNRQFQYAAGVNCGGDDCSGSKSVNGVPTFGLTCPADVCAGGLQVQFGTSLAFAESDYQATNCNYSVPPGEAGDNELEYYCNSTFPLSPNAGVGFSMESNACASSQFNLSFGEGFAETTILISTTQGAGYLQRGQIFIGCSPAIPLYVGYSGPTGVNNIAGSVNVVIE
jgi:hypothetical protein